MKAQGTGGWGEVIDVGSKLGPLKSQTYNRQTMNIEFRMHNKITKMCNNEHIGV